MSLPVALAAGTESSRLRLGVTDYLNHMRRLASLVVTRDREARRTESSPWPPPPGPAAAPACHASNSELEVLRLRTVSRRGDSGGRGGGGTVRAVTGPAVRAAAAAGGP